MRVLISVIDTATGTATAAEMAAITSFNERIRDRGQWVIACGLTPPAEAVVVDGRDGRAHMVEGPLHETAEYVSGFWVVEAADPDDARSLAAEASAACNRRVELRGLL
jgi:hypothetical protein